MSNVISMVRLAGDYLDERRKLGFALGISGEQVTSFARFVDATGQTGPLTPAVVLSWVQGCAKYAKPFSWARCLEVLQPFGKYLRRLDPATEFPGAGIFGRAHRRLAPHIYSDRQIIYLLAACRSLPPADSLRSIMYEALFGLVAATGLRVSEALNLYCSDVDFDQGLLTVRETKFHKSRHVPVHATTLSALKRYFDIRTRHGYPGGASPLFLSSSGGQLVKRTVHGVFQRLRSDLCWTARGSHPHVRIHDLRHTFICRRVQLWQDQGADIDNAIAALSTYVGHAKVSDTYWYLSGVPDLMAVVGKSFERFAADLGEDHHG